MKTIATINFKGGVGKTTVTWCLGDILSSYSDKNVLLFDLDAQASLTQSIEFGSKGSEFSKWKEKSMSKDKTTYVALQTFLQNEKEFKFQPDDDFIYKISDKYHFVPASDDLYWVGLDAIDPEKGRVFIRRLLEKIANCKDLPNYDYVIFDCPPSFTPLSYSVLTCCDLVLIPINPDFFASKGIDLLAKGLSKKIGPYPFPEMAVFANRVRGRTESPDDVIVPFFESRRYMRKAKLSCESACDENINIRFLDAWLPDRVDIKRAITNRKTPEEFVGFFDQLWAEIEVILQ